MVTPFTEEGAVDYEQAKKLALALLDSGSDGLVVAATTGEAPTLTWEEELRLFEEVKSVVGDRGTIVAYTGKGIYQHFKAIAESTNLPIIMYNIPSRVVINMEPETMARLSQIDNIIGVKEASANMEHVAKTISNTREGFLIWSGNDNDTFPIMALGGYGVIGVTTHLVGKQYRKMMDLLLGGKTSEAAAVHRNLVPLVNAMFCAPNPAPVKYALNHLGFRVGKPRLPLTEPDEKAATQIKDTLKKYKIDLPV